MPQRILALDISRHDLRAALIESSFRDFKVVGLYADPGGTGVPDGEFLKAFLERHALRADTVLVTIPAQLVTQRAFTLPFRDRRRLNQTVPFEIESQVPLALDDVVVDYQVLQRDRGAATVLAAMVQKSDLAAHLAVLAEAGLDPKVVDFAPLCGLNLLHTAARELPAAYAFVDLAADDAAVALYRDRRLVGLRYLTPPAAAAGDAHAAEASSAEALARDVRWTLMVLNGGAFDPDLSCVLASEPGEFTTEVIRALSETAGLRVTRLESLGTQGLPGVENGRASAFARPLGLALREVAPATTLGLNFRRGEFTFHQGQIEIRRTVTRIGMLAAAVLVLVIANLFVSYRSEQARAGAIDEQIRNVVADALPGAQVGANPVAQLQAEIDAAQRKLSLLADAAPVGNLTAIDLLHAITTAVPPEMTIDTDEYLMDPDAVRIRGRTQSFEGVDALKKQLAGLPYFRDIQVKEPKAKPEGGVEFRLILTLSKPGQEPAT